MLDYLTAGNIQLLILNLGVKTTTKKKDIYLLWNAVDIKIPTCSHLINKHLAYPGVLKDGFSKCL